MNQSTELDHVLRMLQTEQLDDNLFRGESEDLERPTSIFGGAVLGQALMSAAGTVPTDRVAHSLHAYFLRAGDPKYHTIYDVDRIRDGRSFTTRRVRAIQHGQPIFNMSISFHTHEEGYAHAAPMPAIPRPEELKDERELRKLRTDNIPEEFRDFMLRPRAMETRPVEVEQRNQVNTDPTATIHMWIRPRGHVGDDIKLHQALLAYTSDQGLLMAGTSPHIPYSQANTVQMASLDHAMWFHQPPRFDDWVLYRCDSPAAAGARSFNRGEFFTKDGHHFCSCAQEGLMRRRVKRSER